jgi:alpha-galactosidase
MDTNEPCWSFETTPELILHHTQYPIALAGWNARIAFSGQGQHSQRMELTHQPQDGAVQLTYSNDSDVAVSGEIHFSDELRLRLSLSNSSTGPVFLEKFSLLLKATFPTPPEKLNFYKNGYQSWSETHVFSAKSAEEKSLLWFAEVLQSNLRNPVPVEEGEHTSEMFTVIGCPAAPPYLLIGQQSGFHQFFAIRARFPSSGTEPVALELTFDFGRKRIDPSATIDLDELVFLVNPHANRIQDAYFEAFPTGAAPRRELPRGWCSWYHYFTKVTEQDILENASAAGEHHPDWQVMILDDGYEAAVGDWLMYNAKFPNGLRACADAIRQAGFTPGLWLAPFIAHQNSALYHNHPEWVLRDRHGRPISAGWNPGWSLTGSFYGLDTTHPGFQAYLRQVIQTVVHDLGFKVLKLDFTYGASLYAQAHDPSYSSAERLTLGYQIIRQAAGEDVLLTGCGSPLSPAAGLVDAMRIGPDVAPYWFDAFRVRLTRDPHALCTRSAIRSVLNRSPMHRRLWINDPDCLLLRSTETKLTPDERQTLATAVAITGGSCLVSDALQNYSPAAWELTGMVEALAIDCDQGRAWPLDYMEREMPELVYNSQGYLAVFNFSDLPVHKVISLSGPLEDLTAGVHRFKNVWDNSLYLPINGQLDLEVLPPHASRMLKFCSGDYGLP